MATIKAFSDLQQSKKLAEILPLESADMTYCAITKGMRKKMTIKNWEVKVGLDIAVKKNLFSYRNGYMIPCWSLSALLSFLPNNKHITTTLSRGGWKIEPIEYIDKWFCEYEDEVDEDSPCKGFTVSADNPVDACYEVIIKLYELKML